MTTLLDSLPAGLRTDLGILLLQGSELTHHGDHLVVRSPHEPEFHWGNTMLVTGANQEDAERWLATYREHLPDVRHVALNLTDCRDTSGYRSAGLEVEQHDVLTTDRLPRSTPLHPRYTARPLDGADWRRVVHGELERWVASPTGLGDEQRQFVEDHVATRRRMTTEGSARFFGAFDTDGSLVASLGVVLVGTTARYQDVGTRARHRRCGLAAHLLGLAAQWAADQGADEWVIVTESTNPAGRLYRSVGFRPTEVETSVYRASAGVTSAG